LKNFGQSIVVSMNQYAFDTEEEMSYLRQWCADHEVAFALNNAFVKGGEGAADLANTVVKMIEEKPSNAINFTYADEDPIRMKIELVAKKIYRASQVEFAPAAILKMKQFERDGWGHLPVCIAKTQYSFSDDPKKINAPENFTFTIRDMVVNAGAGFIVAVAGDIMRMPGLPESPQALRIKLVDGEIEGLS